MSLLSHAVFWMLCLFVSIIFLVLTFFSFPVLSSPGLNIIHSTSIIFGGYLTKILFSVIVIQSLSRVRLFETPWTAEQQDSLSLAISQSLPNIMSIESVMLSNHLILCHPLLLLPSIFPSIKVFSNESSLHIRWPKYWSFSFSISPSSQCSGLISLGLTSLISLQSRDSQESSPGQFRAQPSSVHDYWKSHSFDYMDLCWQSDVSTF